MTDASGTAIAQPTGYTATAFPGQSKTLADLYYNRYRDYDPTTGRYIQADPIGLAGGSNPYSYAMGNPVRYVDPLGLAAWPASLDPSGFGPPMLRPNEPIRPVDWTRPTPFMLRRPKNPCPEPVPPPPPLLPADWCGSTGTEWVPDSTWGQSCKIHDACYGTQGSSKFQCDFNLGIGVALLCAGNGKSFRECAGIGGTYFWGVTIFGIGPYNKAQNR